MSKEGGGNFKSGGFALLVVLFILLIIIGTAYNDKGYDGGYGGYGGGFGGCC